MQAVNLPTKKLTNFLYIDLTLAGPSNGIKTDSIISPEDNL
jgi:hypothetical protein